MDNTHIEEAASRWEDLGLLQEHYAKFEDFLNDVMTEVLGFECTEMQIDIGRFLAYGPLFRMVQAQRGEAKSTITAIYAVWRLIQSPTTRVLILSAGSGMAKEIASLIIQIITNMPELECLRPDTTHGDRSSVEAFDVHWQLKGVDKSPSVACIGITGNLQGKRADVLIADDIESAKNSQTAIQRERLAHLTRDFTSICSNGDIIYLGTPQSCDSVYNSLPSRGFTIRIWTGRYPTPDELPNYSTFLAPYILARLEANPKLQMGGGPTGDRGQPTDAQLISEEALTAKEIDQGRAYFQLQHMLDTKLMDADRYPLKSRNLVFMSIAEDRTPIELNISKAGEYKIYPPQGFPIQEDYFRIAGHGEEFGHFTGCHMYVDPAGGGQNADELAYAVTKFIAGRVYLVDVGGIEGGYSTAAIEKLTAVVIKWKPKAISVEKNYGNGAFMHIWQPYLHTALQKANIPKAGIEEVWETGQKELRIIDILEPIIGSGRLVVDESIIQRDWESVQKYPIQLRPTYSFFWQLARLTRDKGSLMHDDRLDAVAGSCRHWVNALAQDSAKAAARIKEDNYNRMVSNPLGNGRAAFTATGRPLITSRTALDKFRRR